MKQEKDLLSDSMMQMLSIRTLNPKKGRKQDGPKEIKKHILDMSQAMYKEAFKRGLKLHERAITPAIFIVSTDRTTYMISDLEKHYKTKEKMVYALRLIVRQFIINGEVPEFFYHFTEVRAYQTKGPNDPFQQYSEKMGIPFPGAPMTTQFMAAFETPINHDLTLYNINTLTGEFTESGNNPTSVTDETTTGRENPNDYGGLFTHIVYKPEDAVEINEDMTVIELKDTSKSKK